ncbi:MFS transporter [Nocardiopsis synnemataformans]|uniref:MFS transporter n=1 Tax=Nocardiopsis synnemataformans TaxID=61305 RepID=UPI003EB71E1D
MEKPVTAWKNPDYRTFWVGQSSFPIGFQVTQFILPLLVVHMGAAASMVGFIRTVHLLPQFLLSVPAGVLADRFRGRRIMIFGDVVRLLTMTTVMVLFSLHSFSLWMLFVAVFVLGSATVFYEVCYHPVLRGLLQREQIASGNFWVELSRAFATIASPALAGFLIGFLPLWSVLAVDAVVAVISLVTLCLLRAPEPEREPEAQENISFRMAADGFYQVFLSPLLRPNVYFVASRNLFVGMFTTYVLVFKVQELGLSVAAASVIGVIGNSGFFLGILVSGWLGKRMGFGNLFLAGATSNAIGLLIVVTAPESNAFIVVTGGLLVYSVGISVVNLQNQILRHSVTPFDMLGRVNAFLRLANFGMLPVGAFLGGLLVAVFDMRTMLLVSAVGALATTVIIVFSPLRTLRDMPEVEPVWARQRTG